MATESLTDAVGLSVLIAAAAFSPEVAAVVGPYVLIAAASVIGASFSLARRPPSSRWSAFGYFARVVGLATFLTVGLSTWLAGHYEALTERALLAPVALLIGFIGHDWPKLLRALVSGIFKTIDNFRASGGEPK